LGWCNVLLGLRARGYGGFVLLAAGLVILAEVMVMVRVLWFRTSGIPGWPSWAGQKEVRSARGREAGARAGEGEGGLGEEYFELVGDDEGESEADDQDYDEDGRLKADVEWEERMRDGGAGQGEAEGGAERTKRLKRLDVV
jgi:hypothetical protein